MESISVTAFSVNTYCPDSSKINVNHKAIKKSRIGGQFAHKF